MVQSNHQPRNLPAQSIASAAVTDLEASFTTRELKAIELYQLNIEQVLGKGWSTPLSEKQMTKMGDLMCGFEAENCQPVLDALRGDKDRLVGLTEFVALKAAVYIGCPQAQVWEILGNRSLVNYYRLQKSSDHKLDE